MTDLIIPKIWEGKEICICVTDERAVFVYDEEQGKFIDTGKTAICCDYRRLCKHCLGLCENEIGEIIASCEYYGENEGRNVTLGECFGNCDAQEEPAP